MNTSRSEQLYKTACGFMPGGVNSPVRACKAVGTVPLFIDHAKGSRIWDEDGNEFELEVLDEFELDGQSYLAALPADMDEDDPDFGIVLLKIIEENGEELFGSIDDDDELDKVYDYYMQEVFADEDEDEAADAEE